MTKRPKQREKFSSGIVQNEKNESHMAGGSQGQRWFQMRVVGDQQEGNEAEAIQSRDKRYKVKTTEAL